MNSTDLLLYVDNLTKRFPQVTAVDCVSLEIARGEIHCLLGENGAGKTTLAECIYGYLRPDSGRLIYKGKPVDITSPKEAIGYGIGMVHQHFVLVEPLSVIENIVLGVEGAGIRLQLEEAEERLRRLCQDYGLELDLHAKIWQLSVGQQQWVEILKTLFVGADLLIFDEPTAVLTPQEAANLFIVLQRMKKSGLSILLITHKLREVMDVSDRVTVLRKGRWITTQKTRDVSREELARLMVGREVNLRIERPEQQHGNVILEVENLTARNDFGRQVLHGISFDLHSGEILGLAGVGGNGQKELSEAIIGVRKVAGGRICLHGKEIIGKSVQAILDAGVGHIPQDRIAEGLVMEFPVSLNLILGMQDRKPFRKGMVLDGKEIVGFAEQVIADFEIATPSTEQITETLSGGNLQKVILARELSQEPRCLVANQPTRGLDVGAIEYVHRKLMEQRQRGAGVLLISEDLEEIFALSDRIAVIYKGQIVGVVDSQKASLEQIGLWMAGIIND
ncbi:MAG: ABC transporter ATP-binding protein [Anaerolineales bacterium]|nr:ABC transporter ATP-binding protein [Anaerolineales bacterium]